MDNPLQNVFLFPPVTTNIWAGYHSHIQGYQWSMTLGDSLNQNAAGDKPTTLAYSAYSWRIIYPLVQVLTIFLPR
jgi:hypothetical protein